MIPLPLDIRQDELMKKAFSEGGGGLRRRILQYVARFFSMIIETEHKLSSKEN